MTDKKPQKTLESSAGKILPPSSTEPKEIFSSRKHSMDYVTADGIMLRTGYHNKSDWYLLLIKELLDNGIDFLWKYYPGANDAAITVDIAMDDSLFHIKVRNTNSKNIPVFENLTAVFQYDMRYGSKQNQHIISRGMLGDAMKQILTLPYVLIHTKDDGTAFVDRQWDKPLIICSNGMEHHTFVHVDKGNDEITAKTNFVEKEVPYTDTEIETTWPIIDEINLDIHRIEDFCKQYIIFTTDISFQFRLTDNSHDNKKTVDEDEDLIRNIIPKRKPTKNIAMELANALTSPPHKATIKIDAPSLHSISTEWNNISHIHSFKPEEFVTTITSVHDKQHTSVYDVLRTFREGTNMRKTPDTEISVAELISQKNKDKKIENLYYALTETLPPSKTLSLPYSNIKSEERKRMLVERISQIYGADNLNMNKAVYKIVNAIYKDDNLKKSKCILQFPYAIEILAISFSDEIITKSEDPGSRFIGAVNYSVSPRGNKLEGEYLWGKKDCRKSSDV